jgi:hypothetical protein
LSNGDLVEARDIIADSKEAIETLLKLSAKLELYTDRLEKELKQHNELMNGDNK